MRYWGYINGIGVNEQEWDDYTNKLEKEHIESNRVKARERSRLWRKNNSEKKKESSRIYYEERKTK